VLFDLDVLAAFTAIAFTVSIVLHGSMFSSVPSPFSPSFHSKFSVTGVCLPFRVGVQLPGFASHGSSLRLGAGFQQWKLLDVSGTQPPFSNAVVNFLQYDKEI